MAGVDPQDPTCLDEPVPDYADGLDCDLRGVRLGLPREYMIEGIDAQVKTTVESALSHFQSLGANVVEISLPHTEYAIDV
jgi:aspartyl-tRNA(Asn)/glutamyl-tRNA(Gln) amidotransferase subunit A